MLVDYKPRRVDVAALREGSLLELVNLVPWGGVDIALKALTLRGRHGWDGVAAEAAEEWLKDISSTQVSGCGEWWWWWCQACSGGLLAAGGEVQPGLVVMWWVRAATAGGNLGDDASVAAFDAVQGAVCVHTPKPTEHSSNCTWL